MTQWTRTRYGGMRRPEVAQIESTTQMKWRTELRKLPSGPIKFGWQEKLGLPECPYVIRWRVETPWFSIRLHRWLGPDDDRHFHDHPWSFVTLVLRGGYTDKNPDGGEHLAAGQVRLRHAEHRHTVVPDPGGAWTIILTGPKVRTWGFWVDGKFRKARKYFGRYGHHPCSSPSDRGE
jgi:hypothetical protein